MENRKEYKRRKQKERWFKIKNDPELLKKIHEYRKKYYDQNKDKISVRVKKSKNKNLEKYKEQRKLYKKINAEKIKQYDSLWFAKNKDKVKLYNKKGREKLRDCYIRSCMKISIKTKDVPKELICAYREKIKLKRFLKQKRGK